MGSGAESAESLQQEDPLFSVAGAVCNDAAVTTTAEQLNQR
jgi:hypothetical protein